MLQRTASRQQRWRRRQRRNEIVAPVVVSYDVLENVLLDLGWITPQASTDRHQVGAAITKLLEDIARRKN